MKPLYTPEQFENAKSRELLPLKCYHCDNTFNISKNEIQKTLKRQKEKNLRRNELKYCNKTCSNRASLSGINTNCKQCNKEIYRIKRDVKRTKTGYYFCSHNCSATYFNSHKTSGGNRSKLELWLESQLNFLYPNLNITYNDTSLLGVELDIYFPSLKLAFELNGIFHYEPIFGKERLNEIQNNDQRKFKLCHDNQISLCVIDTSSQKKFTESSSQKFLSIITNIIDKEIGAFSGNRTQL